MSSDNSSFNSLGRYGISFGDFKPLSSLLCSAVVSTPEANTGTSIPRAEDKPKSEATQGPRALADENSLQNLIRSIKDTNVDEPRVHKEPTVPPGGIVPPKGYKEIERYWVYEPFAFITIMYNNNTLEYQYFVCEPELTDFEAELLERLYIDLRDILLRSAVDAEKVDRKRVLKDVCDSLLTIYGIKLSDEVYKKIFYFLERNYLGYGRIDALLKDAQIEDISCNGFNIPVFLYHVKYMNIKTNIVFYNEEELNSMVVRLVQLGGKHISVANPIAHSTLPDGSRLEATLGREVTTRGSSFSIRKFRPDPFTPVDIIRHNTMTPEILAYLWLAIENNKNLLFAGGTASGKTSSLNAVSLFIPLTSKVITIEDTRELTLYHSNWVADLTREALSQNASGEIDMFELLRAALRQRPEYIIVGEIRGKEAATLFQAMNTGHTTFSTMHAGSIDAAIHRLESEPLNVPRNMLQALNIISVQALIYRGTERVRRVQEVVEIVGIDPATGNLQVNNVFEYDPLHDRTSYTGRSQVYAKMAEKRGWTRDQLDTEIAVRENLLEEMRKQGIRDYISVASLFHLYHINRAHVLAHISDLRQVL
jgi:archaeal flagellar protein FlaI